MKKLSYILLAAFTLLTFVQCDSDTGTVGGSIIPEQDKISAEVKTFKATSRTIMANDSIIANTSDVYLGRYSDSETGTIFTSDFITQFGCNEGFGFPEEGVIGDSATYTTLRLYFDEYYGDSLNAMQCEVYALDKTLKEGTAYYTNLTPEEFYNPDEAPIATKTYSAIDFNLHDTIINGDYSKQIAINLPNSIGNNFIKKYYEKDSEGNHIGKDYFANAEVFINEIFKGIYVKCTHGDGTVAKIYRSRIDVGFDRYIKSSSGEMDSVECLMAPFYSGKEVLQVNSFDNKGLTPLAEEKQHTYIKTPAGLYTEVTLPVYDIITGCDTINSAKIIFTRYNETAGYVREPHKTMLMVRKSEMHKFFLKNKVNDNVTSFLATFDASNNQYAYSNIASLLKTCMREYEEGIQQDSDWESKNPDWNKVVLIPVTTTTNSNSQIVKLVHDISISSIRLRGGTEYEIPIEVITSKFND